MVNGGPPLRVNLIHRVKRFVRHFFLKEFFNSISQDKVHFRMHPITEVSGLRNSPKWLQDRKELKINKTQKPSRKFWQKLADNTSIHGVYTLPNDKCHLFVILAGSVVPNALATQEQTSVKKSCHQIWVDNIYLILSIECPVWWNSDLLDI